MLIKLPKITWKWDNPFIDTTFKYKKFHHLNFDSNYRSIDTEISKITKSTHLNVSIIKQNESLLIEKINEHNLKMDETLYGTMLWEVICFPFLRDMQHKYHSGYSEFKNNIELGKPAMIENWSNGVIFQNVNNIYYVYLNKKAITKAFNEYSRNYQSKFNKTKYNEILDKLLVNGVDFQLNKFRLKSKNITDIEFSKLKKECNKVVSAGLTITKSFSLHDINFKRIHLEIAKKEKSKLSNSATIKKIFSEFYKFVYKSDKSTSNEIYIKEFKLIKKRIQKL